MWTLSLFILRLKPEQLIQPPRGLYWSPLKSLVHLFKSLTASMQVWVTEGQSQDDGICQVGDEKGLVIHAIHLCRVARCVYVQWNWATFEVLPHDALPTGCVNLFCMQIPLIISINTHLYLKWNHSFLPKPYLTDSRSALTHTDLASITHTST